MNPFVSKETKDTPQVTFSLQENKFEITGRSFPENSQAYYVPIINWINQTELNSSQKITLKVQLHYISSASTIALQQVFMAFEKQLLKGVNISIHWIYEEADEDSLESGKRYEQMSKLKFTFEAIP